MTSYFMTNIHFQELRHTLGNMLSLKFNSAVWHLSLGCPVRLIKHFSLSHIWIFFQCALLFTASVMLNGKHFLQNIFFLNLALLALRWMPWPLLWLASSLSLLAHPKVQTIFQLLSGLPSHFLSSSLWRRQTFPEAKPIPHLTPEVLPL